MARRTVCALMGAGLHGLNGICPPTSMKIIKIYVIPRLIYGLECLTLTKKELQPIETYYKDLIRKILHLPSSTANAACYMLVGALPIEALIHIKVLNLFGAIASRDGSLEFQLYERQLAMKGSNSHSWAIYAKKLLERYQLPKPSELLYSMHYQETWKKQVKEQVEKAWTTQLQEIASEKSTLKYVKLSACCSAECHPVWSTNTSDPIVVHKAMIHAKLLVQRYPLRTSHMTSSKTTTCPCCGEMEETLKHFAIECTALQRIRAPHLADIGDKLQEIGVDRNTENILSVALDPRHYTEDETAINGFIAIARNMFYSLHRA